MLEAHGLADGAMQRIAAEVGYSETAFITSPLTNHDDLTIRFFAPEGEVDFCGHATIATAVALGTVRGHGTYRLLTNAGPVTVTAARRSGHRVATLLSPPIGSNALPPDDRRLLLSLLGWDDSDLHPDFPPAIGTAGNAHPVLVARETGRLASLDYDFEALRDLCRARGWITVQLIAPSGIDRWHSRNPFPWGGVYEDPATGSAAAAFAGYLTVAGGAVAGDRFTITQGNEMGRPSTIEVDVLETRALLTGEATIIPPGPPARP